MNRVKINDWRLLSSRVQAKVALTTKDMSQFTNTIHIYQKQEEVHGYSHARLRELNNPVLPMRASHRSHRAEKASTKEAGNLQRQVHVSINSRAMLLENVWADHALFKGAVGTLRDIIWEVGADPSKDAHFALLVAFDGFDGSEFIRDPHTNQKLVCLSLLTSCHVLTFVGPNLSVKS
jgi:hypothetical protein